MKRVVYILVLFFTVVPLVLSCNLYAQEEAKEAPVPNEEIRESLLEEIKDLIKEEPKILEYIPELKADFDDDGEIETVEYKIADVLVNIEELRIETLVNIRTRMGAEHTRVMHDKLLKQIETMDIPRNAPALPEVPLPPAVPKGLPKPPAVQKGTKMPSTKR